MREDRKSLVWRSLFTGTWAGGKGNVGKGVLVQEVSEMQVAGIKGNEVVIIIKGT